MTKLAFFQQLNSFFDVILVLTIPRNKERIDFLKTELAGLSYQIFEGVDGRVFNQDRENTNGEIDFDKAFVNLGNREIKWGEVGCALSHKRAWEYVVSNQLDKVLILEDDVLLAQNYFQNWQTIQHELSSNWDFLYLGYGGKITTPLQRIKFRYFYPWLQKLKIKDYPDLELVYQKYTKPFSKHLAYAGLHDCAHAYAIRKTTAEQLLKLSSPVVSTSEYPLMNFCRNNYGTCFVTKNQLFTQRGNIIISSIHHT